MSSYWDEVKVVLKKGADLAADEIRKDYTIFLDKARKAIDTAANDISRNTDKLKEKLQKSSEKLEGAGKKEFENTVNNLRERINTAVERLKEDSEKISVKLKENTGNITHRAREGAELIRLKTQLYKKQNELKDALADLGNTTLDLQKKKSDLTGDPEFKKNLARSKKLEKQCRDLQEKIDSIK